MPISVNSGHANQYCTWEIYTTGLLFYLKYLKIVIRAFQLRRRDFVKLGLIIAESVFIGKTYKFNR